MENSGVLCSAVRALYPLSQMVYSSHNVTDSPTTRRGGEGGGEGPHILHPSTAQILPLRLFQKRAKDI